MDDLVLLLTQNQVGHRFGVGQQDGHKHADIPTGEPSAHAGVRATWLSGRGLPELGGRAV